MDAENLLGSTRGTEIEERVEMNFKGETNEVGLYLAMAKQAQNEGYPEIAAALKEIAWEEAVHAARFAEMNGKISSNLKENLELMLKGEQGACIGKYEASRTAKEIGIDCAHDFLHESSRDEGRHARTLQGLLKRYF
jgi:rubrerythrin